MAVQIPELKRFDPQAPTPSPQLNVNTPDGTKVMAGNTQAVSGLVNEVDDYFTKQENAAIDNTALNAASDYEVWYKVKAEQGKELKGDPTEFYNNLETEKLQKQKELLEQYGKDNPKLQYAVDAKMRERDRSVRDNIAVTQASQYGKYVDATNKNEVALAQNRFVDAVEGVDINKPETFQKLRDEVAGLDKTNADWGAQKGLFFKNAKGETVESSILQQKRNADVSAGLKHAIAILNGAGKTEEADVLLKDYHDRLLDKDKEYLFHDNKDKTIERQAQVQVGNVMNIKDPEIARNKIKNITDPAVRTKALSILNQIRAGDDQALESARKKSYDNASLYLLKNKDKINNPDAFENDPVIRNLRMDGKLDEKRYEALKNQAAAPTFSDQKVKAKMYDLVSNDKLNGMSPPDFFQVTSGLNQKDKNHFQTIYEKANDQTKPEQRQMYTYMTSRLTKEMRGSGLIAKMQGQNGYGEDGEALINNYYHDLSDAIAKLPPGTSRNDQDKYVQDFVYSKQKEIAFTPRVTRKFISAPTSATPPAPNANAPKEVSKQEAMSDSDRMAWALKFKQVKGHPFGSQPGDNIQEFMKSQGGKL